MSVREEVGTVGSIQIDYMSFDFNEKEEVHITSESIQGWKKKKLLTFGGAIAACVVVDEKTRFCMGELVKTVAKPLELVKRIFGKFKKVWTQDLFSCC